NAIAATGVSTLSLHDGLPISLNLNRRPWMSQKPWTAIRNSGPSTDQNSGPISTKNTGKMTTIDSREKSPQKRRVNDQLRRPLALDRKSTRLNSNHVSTSYAVF